MNWPGAHARSRSLDMDLKKSEDQIMERDHELNMQQLQYGFIQLEVNDNDKEKRGAQIMRFHKKIPLTLNIGAFIRKVVRNGMDKTMSTYWTYKGSMTTPCEYNLVCNICHVECKKNQKFWFHHL